MSTEMTVGAGKSQQRKRVHMDSIEWRSAATKGTLSMYIGQHWTKSAPKDLTDQEWDEHFTARMIAALGPYFRNPHCQCRKKEL